MCSSDLLEVFTTDGRLREAAGKQQQSIVSVYSVRIAGEPSEEWLAGLPAISSTLPERPFDIDAVSLAGGEGRNRWVEFKVRRAHGRDLRNLVINAGFEVSRVLRVQYGPVVLERGVPRARSMELKGEARDVLYRALGLPAPSDSTSAPATTTSSSPGP
mgnify:CR=1 FL=1